MDATKYRTLVRYDPCAQTWNRTERMVVDAIQGVTCLVQVGTTLRLDNVCVETPVRNSLEHTATFVAAYAVGVSEYGQFVAASNTQLRRSRVLTSIGPLREDPNNRVVTSGVHLLTCGEDCWVLRCLPPIPTTFVFRDKIIEERIEAHEWLECFTHYTLERSLYRFAVEVKNMSSSGVFETFCVHTNSSIGEGTDEWPFGMHNSGPSWVRTFCHSHKCNQFCRQFRLAPCRYV